MADHQSTPTIDSEGLRERNVPTKAQTPEAARKAVVELNAAEENKSDDDRHKRTFGRTPDGIGKY